jgi:hypothetical protein
MRGSIPQRYDGEMAIRRELIFFLLAACLLAIESVVLASAPLYSTHPAAVRAGVIFDLCAMPALFWWLLAVRPGTFRPRTIARVVVVSIALCALLFGREVRLLAVPIELALMYIAYTSIRGALQARGSADAATALRRGLADALGDHPASRAVASELSVLWYALFSWGRTAPDGFSAYKRAGWTAIYVAIGMASIGEGLAIHFLVRRFGPLASLASLALHLYFVLWLLGDLRALHLRRIQVEHGVLHLRLGLRWEAEIPLRLIESVQRGGAAQGRRLGVLGSPNLAVKLREPVVLHGLLGIRRTSDSLLLQVDEPDALMAALG